MRRACFALAVGLAAVAACSADGDGGDGAAGSGGSVPGRAATTVASTTAGTPTTAAPPAAARGPYRAAERWLCRPDLRRDPCRDDLDATVLEAGGGSHVERTAVAADPAVDCFYVYPTVNLGAEGNAPFDGEYAAELGALRAQAARFSEVCAVYAPLYRQRTLTTSDPSASDRAYADVLAAWRHYLAAWSGTRGFVLMGHSQGAGLLNRLVREEIDPEPALRARLVSALLIGSTVAVPAGEDAGGDFVHVPACRAPDQFGCVVTYASFRAASPPPPTSFFGRPRSGPGEALCTNPAALGGGSGTLEPYYPAAAGGVFETGTAGMPDLATPFVALPGLASAECVRRDGITYLEITVHPDPSDPRPDDIRGDLTPEWGLHLVDVQLALGNLVDLVRDQARAWSPGA